MIRLFRSVSILMLILIVGLVAIIGLTYRNTNRFAYLFSNPDGTRCKTLCFLGADPASMTVEQMDKVLGASALLKPAERQANALFTYQNDQTHVELIQFADSVMVSTRFTSDRFTLGELLVLLGKPQRIAMSTGGVDADHLICTYFTFTIRDRWVGVILEPDSTGCMNPHLRISSLGISPINPGYAKRSVVWQGFNTNSFYESLLNQMELDP